MQTIHLLPELPRSLADKPRKLQRKKIKIPCTMEQRRARVPDEVVAHVRWCWSHGWCRERIVEHFKLQPTFVYAVVTNLTRPKVDAARPGWWP